MKVVNARPKTRHDQDANQTREKLRPSRDLVEYARQYAQEKPGIVALACIGVGIVLGWKLKPW